MSQFSHHHHHHSSGGSSLGSPIYKSPAQLLYESRIREKEAQISPPYCPYAFLLLFAFFLSFVTLPLTGALIGSPWLIIDSGVGSLQNKTWDGRTSNCVAKFGSRRVAGFLTLFNWEDCNDGVYNECNDYIPRYISWTFCGDSFSKGIDGSALQNIQSSSLAVTSKSAIAVSAILSILTLFSIAILLIRNCLSSGSRLSMRNRGDPFYIKFVRITRLQLAIHIVLIASALGSFYDTVPDNIRSYLTGETSFIGTSFTTQRYYSEETIAAPGQALGIAHCVLSGVSFMLYTLYSFNIESWASSHPIGELEPEPPQPTEAERNAAMASAVSQAHALKAAELMLMLQALQKGGPNGIVDSGAIQSVVAQLVATEAAYAAAYAPKPVSNTTNESVASEASSTNASATGSAISQISTPIDFQNAFNRLSPEARVYLAAEAQRLGMEIPSVSSLPMTASATGLVSSMSTTFDYNNVPSQTTTVAYPYYSAQPQVYPSPLGMAEVKEEVKRVGEGNVSVGESGERGNGQGGPQEVIQRPLGQSLNLGISGHAVFDPTLGYHVFVPNRQ